MHEYNIGNDYLGTGIMHKKNPDADGTRHNAHQIIIYTDGSSRGNPGPGGYGTVLISGAHRKELSEGYRLTTNNRMELMSVIAGLEALKKDSLEVIIYSDSKYVVDSVEKKWVFGWEKKNFSGKKNPDLWMRFLLAYRRHTVLFKWVKGHAENKENNHCDELAVAASFRSHLKVDSWYEKNEKGDTGIFRDEKYF